MITFREFSAGILGSYRLARFDATGLYFFDGSLRSFWNSFWAAVIVAPFFILLIAIDFVEQPPTVDLFRFTIVQGIGYVIGWVLFPLVMVPLCRFADRENRYLRYITAYNWCQVLQYCVYAPLAVLAADAGAGLTAGNFLAFVAFGYVVVYSWFVARAALQIPPAMAVFVVLVDFTLGILRDGVVLSMISRPVLPLQ